MVGEQSFSFDFGGESREEIVKERLQVLPGSHPNVKQTTRQSRAVCPGVG